MKSIVLKRAEDDSAWLIASLQSCKFLFCKIYNTVNYRTILCHVHLRLQSKGGKLQGNGDANRYGKVFSDRPPLLEEVHAVVAIIQHLPVKCGVGLPLRLDAFAAERESGGVDSWKVGGRIILSNERVCIYRGRATSSVAYLP